MSGEHLCHASAQVGIAMGVPMRARSITPEAPKMDTAVAPVTTSSLAICNDPAGPTSPQVRPVSVQYPSRAPNGAMHRVARYTL